MGYRLLLIVLFILNARAQNEGDRCFKGELAGSCVNIRNCKSAIEDIRNRKNPQICSFDGADPVVCCIDGQATPAPKPVATTTTTPKSTSTTEYVPPFYDYKMSEDVGSCEPISPGLTSSKTGQKAWDKCIEYQEQYVYPCAKGVALTGELSRANLCGHNVDELIVGGVEAARGEFPHMALLGYGDDLSAIKWLCGGSIISDRFILTAGHCTSSREFGAVTYVTIGVLKRGDQVDSSKVYRISRIVKHPEYKPPIKYNDIALLETDRQMQLDQFAVPACLHVGNSIEDDKASATGWGALQYRGTTSDTLQKVTLNKFTFEECYSKFPPQRLMKQGFDANTQLCYGDKRRSKDTCQGDSGGPLQIKNKKVHCMYTLIGVTSFGKACGFIGDPGIYTRVAPYVPWIESIVWP